MATLSDGFGLPARQQIMRCHHYLVCSARGLRNLNKHTDENIISTGAQSARFPRLYLRAMHDTRPRCLRPSLSATQSSRRCEWGLCRSCWTVNVGCRVFCFSPSLAAGIGIRTSFIVIVKHVATRLELHLLVACKKDANNPTAHLNTRHQIFPDWVSLEGRH